MKIEGDAAKDFEAVNLASMLPVNGGELVSADDATGEVHWKDKTGEAKSVTLGQHSIRIIRKSGYGR